jgi:hypothetical protein
VSRVQASRAEAEQSSRLTLSETRSRAPTTSMARLYALRDIAAAARVRQRGEKLERITNRPRRDRTSTPKSNSTHGAGESRDEP